MGTKWSGLILPFGVTTGDRRRFLPEGVTARELPLPLKWQRDDEIGHDSSVVVGTVDTIDIQEDGVHATGELFDDLDPKNYERLLNDVLEARLLTIKKVIGPSVDAGEAETVLARCGEDKPLSADELDEMYWHEAETGEHADVEMLFVRYEISAVTLVTTPAFGECLPLELELVGVAALTASINSSGWETLPLADRNLAWSGTDADKNVSEWAGIGTDNPDWSKYASAFLYQNDEANPETKGAYGFQIANIIDGNLTIVPRGVFAVAGILSGSRGGTNIPEQDQQRMREVVGDIYRRMAKEFEDDTIIAPWEQAAGIIASERLALVSSKCQDPIVYDRDAFAMPKLDTITPITITDDGRVFGHIATHDVCHVGIKGTCTTAPLGVDGFAAFHRYSVDDGSGIVSVGRLTYAGGTKTGKCGCCPGSDDHACSKLSYTGAIGHHDDMDVVAYVRAYEDNENNAILVAGVINRSAGKDAVKALARGRVSGDWRSVGGDLALTEVLVLSKERPGFPLPRARSASGRSMSLTAAGTISATVANDGPVIDYERLAALVSDGVSKRMRIVMSASTLVDGIGDVADGILARRANEVKEMIDRVLWQEDR